MLKNKKLVVGNWKMNPPTLALAKGKYEKIALVAKKLKHTTLIIAPSYVHLPVLSQRKSKISWAAQDVAHKNEGSYTGEVSASMIKNVKAEYVIVGHSERRALGETSDVVAKKATTARAEGLVPIICVGETARNDDGTHFEEIKNQLLDSIAGLQRGDALDIMIAYEPVWAVGGAEALDVHEIHTSVLYIRKVLAEIWSKDLAHSVFVLYGGTVTVDNARDIIKNGGVDGLLVGRASLASDFGDLLLSVDKQ